MRSSKDVNYQVLLFKDFWHYDYSRNISYDQDTNENKANGPAMVVNGFPNGLIWWNEDVEQRENGDSNHNEGEPPISSFINSGKIEPFASANEPGQAKDPKARRIYSLEIA